MQSKKDARIGGIHYMVQLKSHLVWGKNEKAKCSKRKNGGGWFCRTGGGGGGCDLNKMLALGEYILWCDQNCILSG